ncbi:hypothetical protein [Limnovirga soli]|uniref:HTH cro/C1-type domain-containing protein n=1 Tax=Limnovirga soli TaxID=2656915 RepID=A0A8J8JRE8_9BACT|nr:hypothetical protein [Limnovirga soli]NNV55787.1 hypothetical protein [Limnovirga soli]
MLSGKKYLEADKQAYPHVGNMLQQFLVTNKLSKAAVAKKLQVTAPVVSAYLKNRSMQVGVLWNVSLAVEHNFMADLADAFPATLNGGLNTSWKQQLAAKDQRIAELEKELAIYKSIVISRNG